jgi:hypothetical protein
MTGQTETMWATLRDSSKVTPRRHSRHNSSECILGEENESINENKFKEIHFLPGVISLSGDKHM